MSSRAVLEEAAALIALDPTRILLLDQHNSGHWEEWSNPLPDFPLAVRVADATECRTLAFDFDRKSGCGKEDAYRDARSVLDLLGGQGLLPVMTESGGGGFHVLARFRSVVLTPSAVALTRRLASMHPTMDGFRMAIRPPGAIHRIRPVRVRFHHGSLDDLAEGNHEQAFADLLLALDVRTPPTIETSPSLQGPPLPLTGLMRRHLATGAAFAKHRSRSEADAALATAFVAANRDFDEFAAAMLNHVNRGGEKAQEIARRHGVIAARRYLHLTWVSQVAWVVHRREETLRLHRAVEALPLRGRAGVTDRRVLHFLVDLML